MSSAAKAATSSGTSPSADTRFTGTLEAKNSIRLVIGTGNADSEANSVVFTDGVTVNGALTCTAQKAVFGRTLKVKCAKNAVIAKVTNQPDVRNVKVTLVDAGGNETKGNGLKTRAVEGGCEVYMVLKTFTFIIK